MKKFGTRRRFWDKVRKGHTSECWLWVGGTKRGYGRFWYNGRAQYAHRVAYMLERGTVPDDVVVRHTCDNPTCVNPRHLVLGTQTDNVSDMVERGRQSRTWTDEKVSIAQKLRSAGFSYAKVADTMGIPESTAYRWSNGFLEG